MKAFLLFRDRGTHFICKEKSYYCSQGGCFFPSVCFFILLVSNITQKVIRVIIIITICIAIINFFLLNNHRLAIS